ncbi:MAG: transglutaminase domain-containing protein, partial [Candidatus Omnitrophota bacterium]|nr:transglutaminase domain-containing protein [Candidatus Omnitrophota bacterium]
NFTITLPPERPLRIKAINERYNSFGAQLKPLKEEEGGKLIYRWEFKAIPQIIPEANMPPLAEVNPTVLASTFGSWQEIYDWWWKLSRDKIQPDSAIREKVKELIKAKSGEREKAAAIYNFCAREIRYVAVEYGQAGFEPHPAADIFRNKYGDCKDKAILLVTMLREAGIKSWPVLIPTKGAYSLQEDLPSLPFNHAIAALSLAGRIIFLDPTAETCSFDDLPSDDQARKALLVRDDGYSILETPLYPSGHNLLRQNLRIKANSDGSIAARKENYTYGFYDQIQRYWLTYTQPELIREELKEKIQQTSIGARLENYRADNLSDLNQPVVLSYDFSGPEYFTSAGNLWIMPQLGYLDFGLAAKDARKYDLDFKILDTRENNFEIILPRDCRVEYLPENFSQDSPWVKMEISYASRENKIFFSEKAVLKKTRVLQEEYPEFKQFFQQLAKKIKQRIVLKYGR